MKDYVSSREALTGKVAIFSHGKTFIITWSCPYKTGHSAFATSRINSLGDFSLNPLWG